jgi:subtilase family serine protease
VTDTVRNIGLASTVGWSTVRYYLSTDTNHDVGDLLLPGFRSVYALGPGATSTGSRMVWMPSTPGTYYVIVCADSDASVNESDETNNCSVSATAVRVGG